MAKVFDDVCTEWLSLLDRFSPHPAPMTLNTSQRRDVAKLIEELGERTVPYMRWGCENWGRVVRFLEEARLPVVRDPRIGILVEHVDALAMLAGDRNVFGRPTIAGFAKAVTEDQLAAGT